MKNSEFDSEELEFRSELKKKELETEAQLQIVVNDKKHQNDIELAKYKHKCDVKLRIIGGVVTIVTGLAGIGALLWGDGRGISRADIKTGASSSNLFPKQ